MFDRDVDVTGEPVICQKWWNVGRTRKCVAGDVHRVDPDLEICVCTHCGQGWIRHVDAWTKLEESMEKLKIANAALTATLDSLKKSFQNLSDAMQNQMVGK